MSDLRLFRTTSGEAVELTGSAVALEKQLQNLIEANMPTLFGVRFLASEYSTGFKHRGRIDSLGIDENGSPVIFEYKRTSTENVINQGLFYLDWLLDHRAEFEALVRSKGVPAADVAWSNPRLVCVAGGFDRYDEHAVQQIDRTIELVRYRRFDGDLLALELLTTTTPRALPPTAPGGPQPSSTKDKTVTASLAAATPLVKEIVDGLESRLLGLSDDVGKVERKQYFAYRTLRNFACIEVFRQHVLLYLRLDPASVDLVAGFMRDATNLGHFSPRSLEVRLTQLAELPRTEPLLRLAYENS